MSARAAPARWRTIKQGRPTKGRGDRGWRRRCGGVEKNVCRSSSNVSLKRARSLRLSPAHSAMYARRPARWRRPVSAAAAAASSLAASTRAGAGTTQRFYTCIPFKHQRRHAHTHARCVFVITLYTQPPRPASPAPVVAPKIPLNCCLLSFPAAAYTGPTAPLYAAAAVSPPAGSPTVDGRAPVNQAKAAPPAY